MYKEHQHAAKWPIQQQCVYNMEIILPKKENEPGKELVIRS